MQLLTNRKSLAFQLENIVVKNAVHLMKNFYFQITRKETDYDSNKVNKFPLIKKNYIKKTIADLINSFLTSNKQRKKDYISVAKFEIGNISFSVASINRSIIHRIIKPYKNFFSSSDGIYSARCYLSDNDYIHFLQRVNLQLSINPKEISLVNLGEGKLLIALPDIFAFFNLHERTLDVLFRKINEIAFDSLLRIVFSMISIKEDGFLLHSAAIKANGSGYVFFGPSQSGKSTIARFAERDFEVLSDELNIIRSIDSEFRVFGTPFIGTNSAEGINDNPCLKGLFLPCKDTTTYLKKMEKAEVLRKLLMNALFFGCQNQLAEKLFNLCNNLVDTIPCFELHFTLTNNFLRLLNDIS
jgi:hypothetical protein